MSLPHCPQGHTFTATCSDGYACLICGAKWKDTPSLPEPPKSPKTRKKAGKPGDAQGQVGAVSLLGAGVQEDDEGVAESSAGGNAQVQEPPADHASTARPRKTGSKKGAETPIADPNESNDPGPWHETLKCPVTSCMAKLRHDPPNVVVNRQKTIHYKCPNCVDVRVSAYMKQII